MRRSLRSKAQRRGSASIRNLQDPCGWTLPWSRRAARRSPQGDGRVRIALPAVGCVGTLAGRRRGTPDARRATEASAAVAAGARPLPTPFRSPPDDDVVDSVSQCTDESHRGTSGRLASTKRALTRSLTYVILGMVSQPRPDLGPFSSEYAVQGISRRRIGPSSRHHIRGT